MVKNSNISGEALEVDFDHEGKSTIDLVKSLGKRFKAFKRQVLWALATDLHELIVNKIPSGRRYDRMVKALKVGEVHSTGEPAFVVYLDGKSKGIRKVDVPKTLIYIRPRRIQDRSRKDIKILSEQGPWTVETIPFWPTNQEAIIHQRKVDPKTVEKVTAMQKKQKDKIFRELKEAGRDNMADSKSNPRMSKIPKAIPDISFEMASLEFGGRGSKTSAIWRQSLLELDPGMVRTLLDRYKKIEQTLTDSRYKGWDKYPAIDNKVSSSLVKTFEEFQKRLGIKK